MNRGPVTVGWPALALAWSLAAISSVPALASPSQCQGIRDADRRHECEGRTGDRGACEVVRDRDAREACRTESE